MKKIWLLIFVTLTALTTYADESSQIYIDIGQGQVKKSLLALTPLLYVGSQASNAKHIQVGQDLYRVIFNDLNVSNFFAFIKPEAYLENPSKVGIRPAPGTANGFKFENWKTIGTEFLVRASYQVVGSDLTMEVYVYHVPTARLVLGKNYSGPVSATRKMAHTFANDLVQSLTGKKGIFTTKVVASGRLKGGAKEIYLMDWDGFAPRKITNHKALALSPAWSTKGDKIAYTGFVFHKEEGVRNADLFIYDISSDKRFLVSYKKGLNSGASFIPGDKTLLMTLSKDGNPDVYRINSDGTGYTRLTRGPNRAMNVEPVTSPDGKTIAFSSDRAGRPHIYLMNADGSKPRRITFAGKYNASPSWSPDGKTIAFAGYDSNHFDIFTMKPDGSNLKRLTNANKPNGKPADNESPSWSPDGRHIMFYSNRSGKNQIYVVSADGTGERRITDDDYEWEKPKWSPYLD